MLLEFERKLMNYKGHNFQIFRIGAVGIEWRILFGKDLWMQGTIDEFFENDINTLQPMLELLVDNFA